MMASILAVLVWGSCQCSVGFAVSKTELKEAYDFFGDISNVPAEWVSDRVEDHLTTSTHFLSSRMKGLSEASSWLSGATEAGFSGVEATGAGDSVRSAFDFFFADLDVAEAGGLWTAEDAISNLSRKLNAIAC